MLASLNIRNQVRPNDDVCTSWRLASLVRNVQKAARARKVTIPQLLSEKIRSVREKVLLIGGSALAGALAGAGITTYKVLSSSEKDNDHKQRGPNASEDGFHIDIQSCDGHQPVPKPTPRFSEWDVKLGLKSAEEAALSQEQKLEFEQLSPEDKNKVLRIIKSTNEQLKSIANRRQALALSAHFYETEFEFKKLSTEETRVRLEYQSEVEKVLDDSKVVNFDQYQIRPLANSELLNDHVRRPVIWQIDINTTCSKELDVEQIEVMVTALKRLAKQGDIVHLELTSRGGTMQDYGLAADNLQRLKECGVGLVVYVDEIAASGGMMMTAVADRIEVAPFAEVGSIGVYKTISDSSEKDRREGIDYNIVVPKGVEVDGLEARQLEVQRLHKHFKDHIMKYRSHAISDIDAVSTGQGFHGEEAVKMGLADDTVATPEQSLAKIKSRMGVATPVFKLTVTREQPPSSDGLPVIVSDWYRRLLAAGATFATANASPTSNHVGSGKAAAPKNQQGNLYSVAVRSIEATVQSWLHNLQLFVASLRGSLLLTN
jgi:ClpP class serine protease